MTRSVLALLGLFLLCTSLAAEQPSPDAVRAPLYVLADHAQDGVHLQGIWRFDLSSRTFTRAAAFAFRTSLYPFGRVHLGSIGDRLVVQGTDYYEFDAASGRFLRRYRALPAEYLGWAFSAFSVEASEEASLQLPSGFYGIPECPTAIDAGCAGFTDPGSTGNPTTERESTLYQRDLPPAVRFGSFRRLFAAGTDINKRTLVTLDAPHRRIWTFRDSGSTLDARTFHQRLSYFTIANSTLAEVAVRDTTWTVNDRRASLRGPVDVTYHDATNALYAITEDGNGEQRQLDRWQPDGSEQTVLADTDREYYALASARGSGNALTTQVIPAIGHANGLNNTRWRSDVWLFNPSSEPTHVVLRRVARPSRTMTIDVAPHASVALPDVLGMLGGGSTDEGGDGVTTDALVVTSAPHWGEDLVAAARTWTPAENGSYGQAVPAVPSLLGYSNHSTVFETAIDTSASQAGFILDKREEHQFRHNMGVVNDTDETINVNIRYAAISAGDGGSPVEASLAVLPHSVGTTNLESLFPPEFASQRPPRLWITASQPAPIWLSMIDNKTGDATFVPYSLLALSATDAHIVVPAVAKTAGANGTSWQSDVYGAFATTRLEADAGLTATFEPADRTPSTTTRIPGVTGWSTEANADDPFWTSIYPDIVTAFRSKETGALVINGASWMAGFTRTYTTRSDGGTYGEMLPFYTGAGFPVQHFAGIRWDNDFRANVGFYNALEYAVINNITIYDAGGKNVAATSFPLAPHESRQISFPSLLQPDTPFGIFGMTINPQDTANGPGRSFAYVSVVDNRSGDPTNFW